MANHGGRQVPLARAHRPRAPIMRVPPPQTAPLTPLRNPLLTPNNITNNNNNTTTNNTVTNNNNTTTTPTTLPGGNSVTLAAPRPDAERTTNEYVETPFRPPQVFEKPSTPPRPARLPLVTPQTSAITKQPIAFTKEHPGECTSSSGNIICQGCGRCKCESCKKPRPLPQRWVCDNACLCSAETIIDYVSCLCCVKGLYYHCSDTDAGSTCADDPCSCAPTRRLARWSCLSALATVLPCLLCYWPLRGCQRAVEAAYARHSRAGCRCPPRPHATTPEKRLLDSSPDF